MSSAPRRTPVSSANSRTAQACGRLARVEFAGGDLPEKIGDAVPVLAHQADAAGVVDGDHRRGAGMANEVQVVLAAVAVAQALGRDIDDAAAVNVMAGNGRWFVHAVSISSACDLSPRAMAVEMRDPGCRFALIASHSGYTYSTRQHFL